MRVARFDPGLAVLGSVPGHPGLVGEQWLGVSDGVAQQYVAALDQDGGAGGKSLARREFGGAGGDAADHGAESVAAYFRELVGGGVDEPPGLR
ncbi:hypothetical protein GCM10010195_66080 [Kitasatospora griseola]|nr:hypothetical protein GCM10010195_66080 [Kitasatospora griseola]